MKLTRKQKHIIFWIAGIAIWAVIVIQMSHMGGHVACTHA